MRSLVTGTAGFIGSHLAERLLALGHQVIGVDNFLDNYPVTYKIRNLAVLKNQANFLFLEQDLLELNLHDAMDNVDYVFHLAGQPGVRSSWGPEFARYSDNNIMATQLLLEAARDHRLKKFVYASSSSVYGNTDDLPMREEGGTRPVSPYGVSKLAAEHLCYLYWQAFAVPTVSLRFFTVYGPRQRPDMFFHIFMDRLRRGDEIPLYDDGGQTRDFTYYSDIIDGIVAACEYPGVGEVFNLGGGSEVSLAHTIEVIENLAGQKGILKRLQRQRGDVRHTRARLDLARAKLNYRPRIGLETGLRQEWEWLKSIATE